MHLVGNNSSMQPTPLWSVDKFAFLHDLNVQTLNIVFCPCYLFFVMKCCDKMPWFLPHNHYCCSLLLSTPVCLPHLLICICLNSSPIACPPSVLCWCLSCFFLFCFGRIFFVFLFFCLSCGTFVQRCAVSTNGWNGHVTSTIQKDTTCWGLNLLA